LLSTRDIPQFMPPVIVNRFLIPGLLYLLLQASSRFVTAYAGKKYWEDLPDSVGFWPPKSKLRHWRVWKR